MVKKTLIVAFILSTLASLTLVGSKLFWAEPPETAMPEKVEAIEFRPTEQAPDFSALLDEIDEKNKAFTSFSSPKVDVTTWRGRQRLRLTGELLYTKSTNFRLEMSSVFGKEVIVGSNEKEFWYWSKRDQKSALYWAKTEDFNKTRLKPPFDPMFLRSSLGIDPIPREEAKFAKQNDRLLVMAPRLDSIGRPIRYVSVIDPVEKRIVGSLLVDAKDKVVASSEIKSWKDGLPSEILYIWHEENSAMSLVFEEATKNTALTGFGKPVWEPSVNMAEQ